ncbi:MAG: hypothetical protein M3N32_10985 [Actinomycetota bacterium]|nr:hypothetical protein [Actinomycetota bacterium]
MLIRVHCEGGVGVSEAFGYDLDGDPVGNQQRRVRVAQVVNRMRGRPDRRRMRPKS